MGLCVIAALPFEMSAVWAILLVAIGLGAVIFVHELGHFLVAKMCGVKCEKFFIGFDIGGIKLSRKWGETEYGIGILPLGGYVKMLGQDDNPGNIAEQVEKSKALADSPDAKAILGPDGETLYVDKRSYLAKSVPQRMAIISAGVIMNILFAFVFAFWAYGIGVPIIPCIVSSTTPGSAAWTTGLEPGDEIVKIGDRVNPSFEDLKSNVLLGDLENGVPILVKRAGTDKIEEIVLKPQKNGLLPMIGVQTTASNRLSKSYPATPDSPAHEAGAFELNDEIIGIGDQPVRSYFDLVAILTERAHEPLDITIRRGGKVSKDDLFGPRIGGEEKTIEVRPKSLFRVGLAMKAGPVSAVQANSPAAKAGMKPGDLIVKINGKSVGTAADGDTSWDPVLLPNDLARLARTGETISITIRRNGEEASTEELTLQPRVVSWVEEPTAVGAPMSVPALGFAYPVFAEIQAIVGGSSAEEAGLQKGDRILEAIWVNLPEEYTGNRDVKTKFTTEEPNWPLLFSEMQSVPPGSKLKLSYQRGEEAREATLVTRPIEGYYWPERGFIFEPVKRLKIASTWGEQAELAFDETLSSLTMVYRFLGKLWEGQIPITGLGGPVTIAGAAFFAADEGLGKLLIFLTMLSANLAVINFLPIPLLDGGHMVFLIYEGIRGRPANERFVIAMHTVGFMFIVSLMLFVFGLDFGWIPRGF